jgi:hypothetical protein
MSDHWDGWPEDGPDFDDGYGGDSDGAAPDFADDGGYPVEGFGPPDDDLTGDDVTGGVAAGAEDLGGADPPTETGPIGYGDEPFAPELEPSADTGLGPAEATFGPADTGMGADELDAEVGFGAAETPVGADPDLDPYGSAEAWPQPVFPDALDLGGVPEPVDGFPWADPAILGDADAPLPDPATVYAGTPEPAELAGYAAEETPPDGEPWTALAASDDPATSALARFWGAQGG